MWARLAQTKLRNSIIWEFEEEFDYRMFDCVRLAQRFRKVRVPNPIGWVRLPAIPNIRRESMRSPFCRKNQVKLPNEDPRSNALSDLTPRDTKSMSFFGISWQRKRRWGLTMGKGNKGTTTYSYANEKMSNDTAVYFVRSKHYLF